jgi:hypothetical protein
MINLQMVKEIANDVTKDRILNQASFSKVMISVEAFVHK